MKGPPKYLIAGSEEIGLDEVRNERAKTFVDAIKAHPYASLVRVARDSSGGEEIESVTFDLQPEIPQLVVNDIRLTERIAVRFTSHDEFLPEVWALRSDFPKLPHLNLRPFEQPKSLCIFEDPEEAALTWTPSGFLDRIREWLSKTALGLLHQDGQPLEPLILSSGPRLILPHNCVPSAQTSGHVDLILRSIQGSNEEKLPEVMLAYLQEDASASAEELTFRLFYRQVEPQTHGVIHHEPRNFGELKHLMHRSGIDILEEVRLALADVIQMRKEKRPRYLIITICIPKSRSQGGDTEVFEWWSFMLNGDITQLGQDLGIWGLHGGDIGRLVTTDPLLSGDAVPVVVLNTSFSLNRHLAQILSRSSDLKPDNYLLIGCGAVGSQLFLNMIRMGIGKWDLVDHDIILGHNPVRFAVVGGFVGFSKAEVLANVANKTLNAPVAAAHKERLSDRKGPSEQVRNAVSTSDWIIDCTSSVPAARVIARDLETTARKMSCFINPKGTDAVLLCEDKGREMPLDGLEMQYYRAVLENNRLADHLDAPDGQIRYSNSCREFTTTLPQCDVATLSGILTSAVVHCRTMDGPAIRIWKIQGEDISVECLSFAPCPVHEVMAYDWRIVWDDGLIERISAAREGKLPSETGGVLVGCHDTKRKIIYLVDSILSPPDSVERETAYVRGFEGLAEDLAKVEKRSGGMVTYVGEWHSHPPGNEPLPSPEDMNVVRWLKTVMNPHGLPAVMAIVGDGNRFSFFLSEP